MKKYTCMKDCGNTIPCNSTDNICLSCGSSILLQPRKGSIAVCSMGYLGLITDDNKKDMVYSDGSVGKAYVGVHLIISEKFFGTSWSSTKPKVIGHIDNFLKGSIEKEIDEMQEILNDNKRRLDVADFIVSDEHERTITSNRMTELMTTLTSLKSLLNEKKNILSELKKHIIL